VWTRHVFRKRPFRVREVGIEASAGRKYGVDRIWAEMRPEREVSPMAEVAHRRRLILEQTRLEADLASMNRE
jgi:hypothetical protein